MHVTTLFADCYDLVIVIICGLAQSDHIIMETYFFYFY
jgi:hypothetical protein